jgi:tetratricopeptide (TPR) repeat protein
MSQRNPPQTTWRAWGDHPVIVTIGVALAVITAVITIVGFVTGAQNLQDVVEVLNPRTTANRHNERGFAYYRQGEHDLAISEFNQAIELEPEEPVFYNNCGNAYSSNQF